MNDILIESVFFGVGLTLLCFEIGQIAKKKLKCSLFNPILIATALIIGALLLLDMDYGTYYEGARYISYLLTPATVCLAIPMYEQMQLLKKNWKAVMAGIVAGCFTSLVSILAMAVVFGLDHETYVTLLPKSITTAIGMGVSQELGGHVTITVAVIIITGILGNMFGETICRIFRIEESIAKGIGIGTAAHAVGTAKAMEMGEIEGAMSSLSIAVAGLITVAGASVFSYLW